MNRTMLLAAALALIVCVAFVAAADAAPVRPPERGALRRVFYGAADSRTEVEAGVDDNAPIGSLYLSSQGKIYLKIASSGTPADDWRKVSVTSAD
jgi:hypothetical protein